MTPTSDRVEIVEMTPQHARHLAPLIAQIDPWHHLGITAQSIERLLNASKSDIIQRAIVVDDTVAGAIVVHNDWLAGPYLRHLSVLGGNQGQGVGKVALDWLIALAENEQRRNVWLCVSAFNTAAIRFYSRHGFERAATLEDLLVAGENEILMRRQLSVSHRSSA